MSGPIEHEAARKLGLSLSGEFDELKTAITLDLCSEIEETRARISGITNAIGGLVFPAYMAAVSLAVIAYELVAR